MKNPANQADSPEKGAYNPCDSSGRAGDSLSGQADALRAAAYPGRDQQLAALDASVLALLDHLLAALESEPGGAVTRAALAARLGKPQLTRHDLKRLALLRSQRFIVESDRTLPDGGRLRVYSIAHAMPDIPLAVRLGQVRSVLRGVDTAAGAAALRAADAGRVGAVDAWRAGAAAAAGIGRAGAADAGRAGAAAAAGVGRVGAADVGRVDAGRVGAPAARVVRARKPARWWRRLRAWQVAVLVALVLALAVLVVLAVALVLR